jgi:CRISPR-associated protein Csm5
MNPYRVTCLSPLLVGDGQKLAPIDYMVWKDQVNVLDQMRIFRLLAKGPRLDGYLAQIRRAERLDFASWGGYAQNFASRRIPLESAALEGHYQRARPEDLFIPTFATSGGGAYLPATALKGPLRTALLLARAQETHYQALEQRLDADRPPRYPAEALELSALGPSSMVRTRALRLADAGVPVSGGTRIYLLRTATLVSKNSRMELGWKSAVRGSVEGRRPQDAPPQFAEMADPGTVFEGGWQPPAGSQFAEMRMSLKMKDPPGPDVVTKAANRAAEVLLEAQRRYAAATGLNRVQASVEALQAELGRAQAQPASCLLCIGWGGGYLTKSGLLAAPPELSRSILRRHPLYTRTMQTGLPFPKTRRIVFLNDEPAALPGWVRVDFLGT